MRDILAVTLLSLLPATVVLAPWPSKHSSEPRIITQQARATDEEYLTWSAAQAVNIGKGWRVSGRVGGAFDLRVIHTEHSYNYKLRATLMTPEVIRATARLEQLRLHLTDEQTRSLVMEAEQVNGLVALVEIDPREGSGVIPLDWRSSLQPGGSKIDSPTSISGTSTPSLRNVKALSGVARRDYAYDIFWVVFPVTNPEEKRIWEHAPDSIDLVVGIYNKEGRVTWPVSDSLRRRLNSLSSR
jgi:hypothetical protein